MRWLKENKLQVLGLGALVVLNLVLVALLMRPHTPPSAEPYVPPTTSAPTQEPAPTTEEPSSPSASPTQAAEPVTPVPTQRLLTIASAERGWRATVGDCDTPGVVEFTADGGQTWEPTEPGLAPVVRLKALGDESLFAIGGAEECAPAFAISASSGAEWERLDNELGGSWFLDPADRNTVSGPAGEAAPCAAGVVDLAGLDNTRAAVLCLDGDVQETSDAGATWASTGSLTGGVAIAPQLNGDVDEPSYLAASIGEGCDGIAVRALAPGGGGLDAEPMSCAPVSGTAPGAVAVALSGDSAWLWAGESVLTSEDVGRTW